MIDSAIMLALGGAALAGLGLTSLALLKGWQGWLDLRRMQMSADTMDRPAPSPAVRIDVADLKERIRKLEAIANGVDL